MTSHYFFFTEFKIRKEFSKYRSTGIETDSKINIRETMDISNSRFYYEVVISSREKYNLSSLQ